MGIEAAVGVNMNVIRLPCYGIEIALGERGGGTIRSGLRLSCSERASDVRRRCADFDRYVDGIESLILAAACAGVDVESPAFVQAIETAVEAAASQT